MGLFNIFKKKKSSENIEKASFILRGIEELFKTQLDERNEAWIFEFNSSIKNYSFEETVPNFFEDRMGMNYLNLSINNQNGNTIDKFIEKCLEKGVGICINGVDNKYDWLFTYGELLDYYLNKEFYSNEISEPFTGKVIDKYLHERQARIGQPSEKYLPQIARLQIRNLLSLFGLENIKIALIWWIESNRITLSFEIFPEMFKNSSDDSLQSLQEFIGWYLPNHYDIIFIKGNEDFEIL